jgi:hypothetical protein
VPDQKVSGNPSSIKFYKTGVEKELYYPENLN